MTHTTLIRATAGATLAATLVLGASPASAVVAEAPTISGLVVIGDSLSDMGRLFASSGGTFPPPPYYQGRVSNGPVAVEYLAAGLGLTAPGTFVNLAVAGAYTDTGGVFGANTGMLAQLAGFQFALGSANAAADGNALYTVWGGANDLRANPTIGSITTAVNNLSTIVSGLHALGARKFLLPNLPDLGLTPEARNQPDPIQGVSFSSLATAASEAFNQQLSAAYGALAAQWSDETFYFFDAMGAQRAITAGSPGNGFTNVNQACFQESTFSVCATPGTYLYWDQIHPSASAHQILGNQMLAAVPEPQSMLMLTAGLLALLGVARRRQA